MQTAPEITFNGMTKTPNLEALVERRIRKLERYCDHITSCQAIVEKNQAAVSSGSEYRARITVHVPPRHELVATEKQGAQHRYVGPDEVIHQAFDGLESQLRELNGRQHEKH